MIIWNVETTAPVHDLRLMINSGDSVRFNAASADSLSWTASIKITSSGFYQLKKAGTETEFYRIEMVKDLSPSITISSPDPHHVIEPGRPARVYLESMITDDYGLSRTYISFTVARGKGEGVKFSETKWPLPGLREGQKSQRYQNNLALSSLGMIPGDELYYYISATDNNNQEYRTDIYIVSIPDTAELMSMEGMTLGVNLIPEYFRSQRHIILDTEKLLREKDTISAEAFKNRSNNLGLDQKLLRLRYGKFLGEESEDEIGADLHDHDHEGGHHEEAPVIFGDATDLMNEYGHSHDNAEDATFFEPELKAQLKATLNEMWKSELELRTYKPAEALPYEYKALRLLKDLQQKSRVYVAKTGFKSTPLNPDKRLSGELDKILQPVISKTVQKKETEGEILRGAMTVISILKNGGQISETQKQILGKANSILLSKAAAEPASYLEAVSSMKRMLAGLQKMERGSQTDADAILSALQRLAPEPEILPSVPASGGSGNLSDQYFKNLKRRNR